MICTRCGSDVPENAAQCPNCGQRFAGVRKTFTATTTSFKALQNRRQRAAKAAEKLPYAIGDVIIRLNRELGLTVILVEQKLPFARRVADRFAILDRGRLMATGPMDGLGDDLVREYLTV